MRPSVGVSRPGKVPDTAVSARASREGRAPGESGACQELWVVHASE